MNTDLLLKDRDKKSLNNGHPWRMLALVLLFLSLFLQQPLIFLLAVFSLVIDLVPGIWYRYALRHLVVRQQLTPQRLFLGEEVILALSIENQKLFPVPWLQFVSTVTPLLPILRRDNSRRETVGQIAHAWTLWSFQRVTRSYRMRCYARGCYTFGSVTLTSSDPFGWFERKVALPLKETLLVYPLIAPPEAFGLAALHPFGEVDAPRRLLEDPMRVRGVRDYQVGDDPGRIHWKATAHAGSLRSKVYEYSSQQRLLLLLDTGRADTLWASTDPEMQEFCIAAAASLAVWALDEGYMVGLLTNCAVLLTSSDERDVASQMTIPSQNGTREEPRTLAVSAPGVSIPYSCGHGQYEHLLTLLSRLIPHENAPIEDIIDRGDAVFATATTVVLVSPLSTLTQATIERLRTMRTLGIALQLVLADDLKEKTAVETHDVPVHLLGGREKWHELIHAFVEENSPVNGARSAQLQLD